MAYAIQHNNVKMLKWLVDYGYDIEATDKFLDTPLIIASELGMTECVEFLIENGANIFASNHIPFRAIEVASNLEIVKLLIAKGEDLNDISEETHALLIGSDTDRDPNVTYKEFLIGRHRRFGKSNPEKAEVNFWLEMIKSGAPAWKARVKYAKENLSHSTPIWSYQRFGRSSTILNDGSILEIAGEHEDNYDPDFCIYNDVTVFKPNGSVEIFIYPKEIFPPTDFHTATFINDYIYIIGSLGYPESRVINYTPVYRLSLSSMEIERIDTTGQCPGWISEHKAKLVDESKILIKGGKICGISEGESTYEDNTDTFQLCTNTNKWEMLPTE